jgi:hypothetical protein
VYTVKLGSSSTPDIVNGSLSFQKELLGLMSGMVRSGKAHNEKMFSGLAPKSGPPICAFALMSTRRRLARTTVFTVIRHFTAA